MPNRLIHETSPYLLQHAHNPVDWYPWGEEAFARARSEYKPVFLSIGYSACHWCHVMERESFENEEVAAMLNRDFVSIKVDREERPDVDSIYMQAVQMMTGHGGWPMSMFLTPEGAPFYGGTYFPPEDRYGVPGFKRILEHVAHAFHHRKDDVARASDELRAILASPQTAAAEELTTADLQPIVRRLVQNFDATNGGFGSAPKFPPSMTLEFLLQLAAESEDQQLQHMVEFSLRKMASGGIYDQIGGGFHRYSVDAHWLVPHFEKMLYDNALLARLYVHAWQRTHDDFYARIARETIGFVAREMTSPDGGFYSTLDADSEGEEGKFYVWSRDEVLTVLGEEEGKIFCALFDVTTGGNWEEKNILNVPRQREVVQKELGVSAEQLDDIVARGKCKLYGAREKRVRPGRDEKILAGWNGWMLGAISEAAMAFDWNDARELARRNADFLCSTMMPDNRLQRSYKDGRARINALLEDYAGVAWGLLLAFEALQERRYLDVAKRLAEEVLARFADEEHGGFFDTPTDHEKLIARPKDVMDNATPSGNSLGAEMFVKLSMYFGEERFSRAADSAIGATAALAKRYPSGFGFLLCAANYRLLGAKEIAITGADEARRNFVRRLGESYVPRRIVIASGQNDLPLMQDRPFARDAAYVCEHYSCLAPATTPEEFAAQLQGKS